MKIEKINNNHNILEMNDEIIFTSYESIIAIIKNGVLTLGRDWDYSTTTKKYLFRFLNIYFVSKEIDEALNKNNKTQAIQKLIDTNIIKYDEICKGV